MLLKLSSDGARMLGAPIRGEIVAYNPLLLASTLEVSGCPTRIPLFTKAEGCVRTL